MFSIKKSQFCFFLKYLFYSVYAVIVFFGWTPFQAFTLNIYRSLSELVLDCLQLENYVDVLVMDFI